MTSRWFVAALSVTGAGLFVLALGWPTAALIGRCILDGQAPTDGFAFSLRQWGLVGKSVLLALGGTLAALSISLPGAVSVARSGQSGRRPVFAAGLMLVLLCPPMVYVFGWDRLLPSGMNGSVRCAAIWGLWAWPIPAVIVGNAWDRIARGPFEAALLVTHWSSAFFRVGLPALLPHVGAGALILFLLFFGDYGVPHACGLRVYATELLAWAATSVHPVDTVWPSMLALGITGCTLAGVFHFMRRFPAGESGGGISFSGSWDGWTAATLVCFLISWGAPVGSLLLRSTSTNALMLAWETYRRDLAWSLGAAALAGVLSIGMGLAAVIAGRRRMPILVWSVLFGAMPGALIGTAMIAAYNHPSATWMYDHWPIVSLSYTARFGWLGVLACVVFLPQRSELTDQAAADGASRSDIIWHLQLPMIRTPLFCVGWTVTALALADVAASSLVRVPTFNPVAHVLMEKFHFFEERMVVALGLWLVAAGLPAALWFLASRGLQPARIYNSRNRAD